MGKMKARVRKWKARLEEMKAGASKNKAKAKKLGAKAEMKYYDAKKKVKPGSGLKKQAKSTWKDVRDVVDDAMKKL